MPFVRLGDVGCGMQLRSGFNSISRTGRSGSSARVSSANRADAPFVTGLGRCGVDFTPMLLDLLPSTSADRDVDPVRVADLFGGAESFRLGLRVFVVVGVTGIARSH